MLKRLKLLDAAMMCVCAPRVLAASNSFSRPGQWLTALAIASHKYTAAKWELISARLSVSGVDGPMAGGVGNECMTPAVR